MHLGGRGAWAYELVDCEHEESPELQGERSVGVAPVAVTPGDVRA